LVDVRSTSEFAQGVLPNAINLPLQAIMSADQIVSREKPIILYCVAGARSSTAKNYLMQMGFEEVGTNDFEKNSVVYLRRPCNANES